MNTEHPSRLLPEFVTEEEEEELLATFHWDETGGGKMKHRQVLLADLNFGCSSGFFVSLGATFWL